MTPSEMTSTEKTELRLPSVGAAIGFYLMLIVVLIVFVLPLIAPLARVIKDPQIFLAIGATIQAIFMILLVWGFVSRGRFDWRATLSLRLCRPSIYLWAVVSVISLSIIMSDLASYLVRAFPGLMSSGLLEIIRLSRFNEPGAYIFFASALSLGAAISEELAFRGFILCGLSARLGSFGAITISAFLFALLHLDPLQSLLVFPVGIFLGYLVLRSGSLYPAILAHAVNNLWSTVEASLWQAHNPDVKEILLDTAYSPLLTVAAIIVLTLGLYAIHRVTKKIEGPKVNDATISQLP